MSTIAPSPDVVFLSGSLNPVSRADRAARWCQRLCVGLGARATLFAGADLEFPFYRPGLVDTAARGYLDRLVTADAVVLVSPSYHGALTGLLKNALDYANELAADVRPFLDGRAVGCVAVAGGEQGASSTLAVLRDITHALRGWPTPMGVELAGERAEFDDAGTPAHPRARRDLTLLVDQVVELATWGASRTVSCGPNGRGATGDTANGTAPRPLSALR
jgi:FMN reductase